MSSRISSPKMHSISIQHREIICFLYFHPYSTCHFIKVYTLQLRILPALVTAFGASVPPIGDLTTAPPRSTLCTGLMPFEAKTMEGRGYQEINSASRFLASLRCCKAMKFKHWGHNRGCAEWGFGCCTCSHLLPLRHSHLMFGCSMPPVVTVEGSDQDTEPTHPCDVPWKPNLNPYSHLWKISNPWGLQLKQLVIVFWRPSHGCIYGYTLKSTPWLKTPWMRCPLPGRNTLGVRWPLQAKAIGISCSDSKLFQYSALRISTQHSPPGCSLVDDFKWSRLSSHALHPARREPLAVSPSECHAVKSAIRSKEDIEQRYVCTKIYEVLPEMPLGFRWFSQ